MRLTFSILVRFCRELQRQIEKVIRSPFGLKETNENTLFLFYFCFSGFISEINNVTHMKSCAHSLILLG